MGIIAERSVFNYSLFSSTRLNVVYTMSEIISDGIADFVTDYLRNKSITGENTAELANFL